MDRAPSMLRHVRKAGPGDPVLTALLLVGPIVIGVIALLDRTVLTTGIASLYILVFVGEVGRKGLLR